MSPDSVQLPLAQVKHLNHGLFSDYYLEERLPKQPDWLPLQNQARQVRAVLKAELERIGVAQLAGMDEAQLEAQWVQPVLRQLGQHFSVQVKVRYGERGYRKPDYAFVRTQDEASGLTAQIYTPNELKHALAVGDAKKWGISLDQSAAKGERNPSQQIDEYLRYSELPWGILTDGRYWRLYEKESSKNNLYYGVDLVDLLTRDDPNDFIYFYAFFRQAAFTDGWLNKVLAGSSDYAERLSDTLENQVYDALELIAQGFLDYRRNQLEPTPDTLRTIYEQSLVLLYRLLFILYAESREILPIRQNDGYAKRLSLEALKKTIATVNLGALDPDDSSYYGRLKDLFFGIDQGNPRYDLPAYNGRLFSAAEHPFLNDKFIGDKHLAPALDKMARVADEEQGGKLVTVDYRDLEVRHLGAIYEKLLEYQLEIATEPLTVKEDEYVPAKAGDKVIKHSGEVILRTGNNKRKVTGSYYTPDYIVRFIVERTLEPLLTEITERYATRQEDGSWLVRDGDALREAILDLNILDPATGSGHFMVDAAAYIAEWLRSLALAPADLIASNEDELIYWKRQVVSACIYGVDINPLAVELAKLSLWLATLAQGKPLSFLDHHLKCGNSLVGTRVEDIGAELVDQKAEKKSKRKLAAEAVRLAATGQMTLFDLATLTPSISFAVGQMQTIERTIAATVKQVKQQELQYAELIKRIKPWTQIADVWTARHFGLTLTADQWQNVKQYLLNQTVTDRRAAKQVVETVEAIAQEQRFLHWELVFPEIFFAPDGTQRDNAGFDAVIGNPPYVRQERIQPIKPYLATSYKVNKGTADLFLFFYELGLKLLKAEQRLGYITSGTYMNSDSASKFRMHLHKSATFETVFNFGENQPFRGAEMVYPTIAILRNSTNKHTIDSYFIDDSVPYDKLEREFQQTLESSKVLASPSLTDLEEWRFQLAELTDLFLKVRRVGSSLGNYVNDNLNRGITTGANDVFVITAKVRDELVKDDPRSEEIIAPVVHGENIRPWYQIDSGEYIIFTRRGIKLDDYPAIRQYLSQFRSQLEPKPDTWKIQRDGTWNGRKEGTYAWYEIQDSVSYYEMFKRPKIFWAEISKLPRFSWDESGLYATNKAHLVIPPSWSLLSILNSRVTWFVISQLCVPLRLRAGLWQYQLTQQFVTRLPIPELTAAQESKLANLAETTTAKARERYQMHEQMRRRIGTDLGQGGKLNEKLEEWWELADVAALRTETKKAFRQDIPLRDRNDWEGFLADQKGEHQRMTAEIVALETRLNAIVYEAFKLTRDEIGLIETATKYPYGAV